MPNVLVIGATGYVGLALCDSLIRSGSHIVYGLARTPEKAQYLSAHEIIPVLGSVADSKAYLDLITSARIDIVVDAAGARMESLKILDELKIIGAERLKTAAGTGVRTSKLGFIYLSGVWVHGSSHAPVHDLMPVGTKEAPTQPSALVTWRPAVEQQILAANDILDTMVIRPALIYGRSAWIWDTYFSALAAAVKNDAKSVELPIEVDSRPGLIHVDDAVSGIHAAIDKLPLISGTGVYPVFDLITSQESMRDIVESAAQEFGFQGEIKLVGAGEDLFMQAMSVSLNGTSARAIDLLSWRPKRFGMVQRIGLYVKSWEAVNSEAK